MQACALGRAKERARARARARERERERVRPGRRGNEGTQFQRVSLARTSSDFKFNARATIQIQSSRSCNRTIRSLSFLALLSSDMFLSSPRFPRFFMRRVFALKLSTT